jgi:dienelactone hydrolase
MPKPVPGRKAPAIVLVHGGDGSAFAHWAQLWAARGYAAISMDTCGSISEGPEAGTHLRHEDGGPSGWGGFNQIDEPSEDQWNHHAVANVVLAHSLIRSLPGVDAECTGVTGISWGGYLTCIAAGIDPRFKFAAPVYGCGFLHENSVWLDDFEKMGAVSASRWHKHWDPQHYLPAAAMPMLWVTGTNDFAYPLDSLQKSYRLPSGPRTLCVRVRMVHDHYSGEAPEEIRVFADSILLQGSPLIRVTGSGRDANRVWVTFSTDRPAVKAELNYTTDQGPWNEREWQTIPADLNAAAGQAAAALPPKTTAWYLNIFDDRDLVVSTEHEEIR